MLDLVAAGRCRRLMVFMPPQHGKSELVSRRFPAFMLGLNPDLRLICQPHQRPGREHEPRRAADHDRRGLRADLLREHRLHGRGAGNHPPLSGEGGGEGTSEVPRPPHDGPLRDPRPPRQSPLGGGGHFHCQPPADGAIIDDPFGKREDAESPVMRQRVPGGAARGSRGTAVVAKRPAHRHRAGWSGPATTSPARVSGEPMFDHYGDEPACVPSPPALCRVRAGVALTPCSSKVRGVHLTPSVAGRFRPYPLAASRAVPRPLPRVSRPSWKSGFPAASSQLMSEIRQIADHGQLKNILRAAATVTSSDELRKFWTNAN